MLAETLQADLHALLNSILKEDGILRSGNNLKYHCPFCNHRKRKFEIKLDKGNPWNCWVCGKSGHGVVSLAYATKYQLSSAEIEKFGNRKDSGNFTQTNTAYDFKELIDARLNGTESNLPSDCVVRELPKEFKPLWISPSKSDLMYNRALNYVTKRRRLSYKDIMKYNIGYCMSGEYADRIIFPSYDKNHKLNFFTGRSLSDECFLKYQAPAWDKNIIGYEEFIDFTSPINLCEGVLDAISIKHNAIPLYGKQMSHKLKSAIFDNKCPEVRIILDNDALKSAVRMAEFLYKNGISVKLVELTGKDPNVLGYMATSELINKSKYVDFDSLLRYKMQL
jgi:ribosomal protein L37AE/L43A